jgi:hypothetical protein
MKMRATAFLWALGAMGAVGGASAQDETFRCHQPDGGIVFQQVPCPLGEMAPPEAQRATGTLRVAPAAPAVVTAPAAAVQPAAPPPVVAKPVPAPRPAAAPARVAAAPGKANDDEYIKPTKRKRDILEMSAQFQRCRADMPGFAEKSEATYAAWIRRHGPVLAEYERELAIKVRAGRRGEATLPLRICTDEWLHSLEPLTRTPDARFGTVEKTWQVFMGALMTGDRTTAIGCLAGRAETRWKDRVERLSDDDLRRIAASIRALKVQWGDDYEKEGVVADMENRAVGIAFRNVNEEWKITDWGTPAAPLVTPVVKE